MSAALRPGRARPGRARTGLGRAGPGGGDAPPICFDSFWRPECARVAHAQRGASRVRGGGRFQPELKKHIYIYLQEGENFQLRPETFGGTSAGVVIHTSPRGRGSQVSAHLVIALIEADGGTGPTCQCVFSSRPAAASPPSNVVRVRLRPRRTAFESREDQRTWNGGCAALSPPSPPLRWISPVFSRPRLP